MATETKVNEDEVIDDSSFDKKVNPIFLIKSVRNNVEAPVEWIQPGMLREGTVTMLVGKPSAGKPVLALSLGNAIANGLNIRGHQHTPRPVLYLDRDDNSHGDVIDRMDWPILTAEQAAAITHIDLSLIQIQLELGAIWYAVPGPFGPIPKNYLPQMSQAQHARLQENAAAAGYARYLKENQSK
jgi:AAA domain-containing protein